MKLSSLVLAIILTLWSPVVSAATTGDSFLTELEKVINSSTPPTSSSTTGGGGKPTPAPSPTPTPSLPKPTTPSTPTPAPSPTPTPTIPTPTPTPTAPPESLILESAPADPATRRTAGNGVSSDISTCTLPAVENIAVEQSETKSILKWAEVSGAAGYDVLKLNSEGKYALVERVYTPYYTIYLAPGKVQYSDFKIAAVCSESQAASANLSRATRVQT